MIWRFFEWKSKTLVQHLANRTNCEMLIPYDGSLGTSPLIQGKSCYDSAHICPIRAEISTHEHWENVFILYFVWLVVVGFRQNYFLILPNFGDFGVKMSFFRHRIKQNRKIFIKHCPPPMFQNTTYIRDVYLYNKQSV